MRHSMKPRRKLFFLIPIVLLFIISAIVMWLWNAILPEVLGATTLTYWQAMGLLVLSKILFGGFPSCGRKGRRHLGKKQEFLQRIKAMSPEERERFKELWKQKYRHRYSCGHRGI
ncbi:MAG: hypothetical protein R2773_02665 [Flavobacteriaceae bacterium]